MKAKNLFFGIMFFLLLQINAQTDNNTIVNDNSSWATLIYELGIYNMPYNVGTEYVYFDEDSIIGEHIYKKVFSCNDSLRQNIKYEGLIREEDKKTYFIQANSETEYLLYDFSLEEGMSFEYSFFWTQEPSVSFDVNIVDSIEINGNMKKYIELTLFGRIIDIWIEEIGSISGILYPMYKGFLSGNERLLLCYYQNNELIYKNINYSECYYDKSEDVVSMRSALNKYNINVYPNPSNDKFIISASEQTISNVEIFDISGKKIYGQSHGDTIDASSFSNGLYLIKIYDVNKQITVFKIIKR